MVSNPALGQLNRENVGMVANPARGQLKRENVGMVANPARGQLHRENELFPVPVRAREYGLAKQIRLFSHSPHPG